MTRLPVRVSFLVLQFKRLSKIAILTSDIFADLALALQYLMW